jgi:phytoene synthase
LPPRTFTDVTWAGGGFAPNAAALVGSARAGEPDRYLAALLAPQHVRGDLLALAAFAAELARIPLAVRREPAMGTIRLKWWRDAIELPAANRTGHPIVDHLRLAVARHGLQRQALIDMIDARGLDLEALPFADDGALDRYLFDIEGQLFASAAQMLGGAAAAGVAWSASAGRAYGLARLLLALPGALARGHLPIPQTRLKAVGLRPHDLFAPAPPAAFAGLVADLGRDARLSLEQARSDVTKLPREASIAVLPLALVEAYVRASTRRAHRSTAAPLAAVWPLGRMARILAARWFGSI